MAAWQTLALLKGLTNHRLGQLCVTPLDSLRQALFFQESPALANEFPHVDK